jgi:hypothetical protein
MPAALAAIGAVIRAECGPPSRIDYHRAVSRNASRLAPLLVGVALAFGLAAGSVVIQRDVMMAVGNLCGPTSDDPFGPCYAPRPVGGWPFAFVYDSTYTSVQDQLGVEDEFRPGWFLMDASIFAALLGVAGTVGSRVRSRWRGVGDVQTEQVNSA